MVRLLQLQQVHSASLAAPRRRRSVSCILPPGADPKQRSSGIVTGACHEKRASSQRVSREALTQASISVGLTSAFCSLLADFMAARPSALRSGCWQRFAILPVKMAAGRPLLPDSFTRISAVVAASLRPSLWWELCPRTVGLCRPAPGRVPGTVRFYWWRRSFFPGALAIQLLLSPLE